MTEEAGRAVRMGDGENWLELSRGVGAHGDLLVVVAVHHSGFSGTIDVWILREAWDGFVADLRRLEKRRQGAASVEGMSPRELSLTVQSIDRSGHLAVEGQIGIRGQRTVTLRFSPIEFDPTTLPGIVVELAGW